MNVLVVYEEVPEEVSFYLIEDPTEEEIETLDKANGTYVNGDDQNQSTLNVIGAFNTVADDEDEDDEDEDDEDEDEDDEEEDEDEEDDEDDETDDEDEDEICDPSWIGKWTKNKVETPILQQVDRVYHVGFIC